MEKEFWNFYGIPVDQGWYAVLIIYLLQEMPFPSAAFWDGTSWNRKAVIAFGEKRDTYDAAKGLAYEHDPDA